MAAIKYRFIAIRDTSCYLSVYFTGKNETVDVNSKCGWKKIMIGPAGKKSLEIAPGNWVAVIYESRWYVSQVSQLDKSDDTYFVTFLETTD